MTVSYGGAPAWMASLITMIWIVEAKSLHETHSASILRGHFLKRDELGNRSEPTTLVTVD
jgi:hypothetical protein